MWIAMNNKELKSNQRIIELAQEFKKLGNYPYRNSTNGSFLGTKRKVFKDYTNGTKNTNGKWYPSDIEVAKAHGLPDDWMITIDFEKESNQRVIELAQEFKKIGAYPSSRTKNGNFLNNRRKAFKDYTNSTKNTGNIWYPSDIEVAKAHGLPDDWMLTIDREKESNKKVIELSLYFKKYGTYPNHKHKLGSFLVKKIQTHKRYINGKKTKNRESWYPSDIEVAKAHGLPDDLFEPSDREKESNKKVIELAQEFKKIGAYPNRNNTIGNFLTHKRRAFKDYINGTKTKNIKWYQSDAEVAKAHGLPDDWMITTDFEKESNQRVIKIALYFKKYGTYPYCLTALGQALQKKIIAFKYYTNGTKNTKTKWYPSDIEVAKAHGLPDDWYKKRSLISWGESRTKFILEKFNIKPTTQYRHKLCTNERCLPFDFYFNKDNLHYFIEYNGEQHYRPVFGQKNTTKEKVFEKTQTNDLIKLNFCKKYNYPLLIIPYWIKDFEKLISEFIKTTQFDPTFAQPKIINQ